MAQAEPVQTPPTAAWAPNAVLPKHEKGPHAQDAIPKAQAGAPATYPPEKRRGATCTP